MPDIMLRLNNPNNRIMLHILGANPLNWGASFRGWLAVGGREIMKKITLKQERIKYLRIAIDQLGKSFDGFADNAFVYLYHKGIYGSAYGGIMQYKKDATLALAAGYPEAAKSLWYLYIKGKCSFIYQESKRPTHRLEDNNYIIINRPFKGSNRAGDGWDEIFVDNGVAFRCKRVWSLKVRIPGQYIVSKPRQRKLSGGSIYVY